MTDEYTYPSPGKARFNEMPTNGQAKRDSRATMAALLDKAKEIVSGSRHESYGDPIFNHTATAEFWTTYLHRRGLLKTDAAINARDVCNMNNLQKISRDANWPTYDNQLDIAGYSANAAACTE